jgi:hypothetical protein
MPSIIGSNKMWIDKTSFLRIDTISKIEERYNATYIFDSCLRTKNGSWGNFPCAIFYTEKAYPEGSNYFGLYHDMNGDLMIANGISATEVEYTGIVLGERVLYSRFRHDYRGEEDVAIDGGRDYTKISGDPDTVKFKVVKDHLEFIL